MDIEVETDLVCNQLIDTEKPRFFSDYDDRIYPFCSPECKRKFDDHPDNYIQQHAREQLHLDGTQA